MTSEISDTETGAGQTGAEQRYGEFVAVRRHGHVAELVLDRPKAMNAVSTAMARSIAVACAALSADGSARTVVVTSTHDRAFCVGADLKERNSFTDAELVRQRPTARAAYTGVLELPMPTVAAVHGFALGGGFELALACDLIVADATAVVGLPEVSVGVIPGGGGTQLLPRRVGAARAAELVFTARRVQAAEARELGLVDILAEDARTEALELAGRIAANSPVGLRAAKRALRLGHGLDLRAGLEVEDAAWRSVAFSGDRAEGVAAFNEKRTPQWPGE
ncbi:enoyl-CoA hydratase-related protein [Streptomyces sp. NBC_01267]|uniref:enoyl-CoA hydratase/isomerase family protein n=1 Tax=unclassified Streptomyces TaxID=2593676 RepID=UPI002025294E|nr:MULTISPECIES: enoyl-CoA hydratase-related protein [unclassified Streptomyces]MCX4548628.1 enoyl-CoA hydratase-related protein [Streptomyces sp. NBC_01500]WSC20236.1 enoyl-CoA hydratase-related protein [Streptomyces sp. NBC_01766]